MQCLSTRTSVISAALFASLALITFTPAQPPDKTKTLSKIAVIQGGKGKARPSDFPALEQIAPKNTNRPKGKIESRMPPPRQHPQKFDPTHKFELLKSARPMLFENYASPNLTRLAVDLSGNTFSLDARTPFVDDKGYIDYRNPVLVVIGPADYVPLLRFYDETGHLRLFWKASKAGLYLVTFDLWHEVNSPLTLTIESLSGKHNEKSPRNHSLPLGGSKLPIFYTIRGGAIGNWHEIDLHSTDVGDWTVFSVEVQHVPPPKDHAVVPK